MPLFFVTGDLLECKAQAIVHQTNCISRNAKGLAKAIFDRWPECDVYKNRSSDVLIGKISTCETREEKFTVINLFGQISPGNPGGKTDSKEKRLDYFKSGLAEISCFVKEAKIQSIAFPENIGCGYGGGNWEEYKECIELFAKENEPLRVFVIALPKKDPLSRKISEIYKQFQGLVTKAKFEKKFIEYSTPFDLLSRPPSDSKLALVKAVLANMNEKGETWDTGLSPEDLSILEECLVARAKFDQDQNIPQHEEGYDVKATFEWFLKQNE